MLTTLALFVLATSAPIAPTTSWQHDLLASPMAQKALHAQAAKRARSIATTGTSLKGPQSKSGSLQDTGGNVPGNWDEIRASWQPAYDASSKAYKLLDEGRYDEAYASITQFRQGRRDDITDDVTVFCALLTRHFAEAYELLIPMVRRQGDNSPQYWLALSFASAELGHVYPGQADFCRAQVAKGLGNEVLEVRNDQLVGRLVAGTDPKTTATLSCLGLGFAFGMSTFLEDALRLDPQNVMAAHALIYRYGRKERAYDVRRIATAMVGSLRWDDPQRAEFLRVLAASQ